MKLNKNIIIAAIAGITSISPIVSQASVALADTIPASTEPAANGTDTSNSSVATTAEATQDCPKVEPISLPIQDKDPEPQAKLLKTNKRWSKRHQRANKYYNKQIKKGLKLESKEIKVALYKKTLKHFKNYKNNYAKSFKKYLKAEIKWLNRQIAKENEANKPANGDVPTTKPSGDLAPLPVNPKPVKPNIPKKSNKSDTNENVGARYTNVYAYSNYVECYKYYLKHPLQGNKKLVLATIKDLKKRGYKFNSDLSDKGHKAQNKKLAVRDDKLMDEGKLG